MHLYWQENICMKKNTTCSKLEAYDETPIFIPVEITEDVVESVAWKLLRSFVPGGTDLEDIQGRLFKFRENRKILHTSVETFVDWIANKIPPWAAYCAFMSGRLIALEKKPGVPPVGIGETWRQLFAKCVMRVTGPEATRTCQYEQICDRLKSGIDGTVHRSQSIWDTKSTT